MITHHTHSKQIFSSNRIFMKWSFNFLLLIFIFLIGFITHKIFFPIKDSICWNDINFKKAEETFSKSPIIKAIPFYEYSGVPKHSRKKYLKKFIKKGFSPYWILFFDNGLKAFAKSGGFRRHINTLQTYHFSQLTNFRFVPPTVIRFKHSVQLFIDNSLTKEETKTFLLNNLTPIQKSDIYIFHFLFGLTDPHLENILVSKNCNRPAFIDNDWFTLSYIKYGDYPFIYFNLSKMKMPALSIEDYKSFPLDKVQSLNKSSIELWKKHFQNVQIKKNIFLDYVDDLLNHTLYFVKWRNGYWFKTNFKFYQPMWKKLKPTIFSKKTLKNLKKLNGHDLDAIFSLLEKKYNYKLDENLKKSYISSVLYRKDILLKEAKKLNKTY